MDNDERKWVEEVLSLCETAGRKHAIVLFVRRQDSENEADIVVTNAETPEMASALLNYVTRESE